MAKKPKVQEEIGESFLGALLFSSIASALAATGYVLTGTVSASAGLALNGLAFPAIVLTALAITGWGLAVHGPGRLRLRLVLESSKRRYRVLFAGPFLLLAWVVVGQVALFFFSRFEARPRFAGIGLGLVSAVLLLQGSFVLEELSTWASRRYPRPSLLLASVLSLAIFGGGVALLAALGETHGAGFPFGLYGVLRRDEIVWAPVRELLFLGAAGYFGALVARRVLPGKATWFLGGLVAFSAASSFFLAVQMTPDSSLAIERSRGLGAVIASALSGRTDRDKDGSSRYFGGGDCDDAEPTIHPGAVDVPGNGRDEDCSGSDEIAATKADVTVATNGAGPVVEKNSASPAPSIPKDLNVVLLTVDTMRFDLGYTRTDADPKFTPALDALAKKSLVFERGYSLASYTSKSLSPMLIGRYPSETARTFEHFDRFSPSVPWLPERLQKAGITTASVQGYWYFFFKGYGFERGYDVLKTDAAPKVVAVEGDKTSNGDKIADGVIASLGELEKAGKRFFLWGHWVEPHAEYVPHEGHDFGSSSRQRYDGELSFVDSQLGRIFAALDGSPLGAKTVVIVTSDHGEAFGEHGMIRHGFELWEELVHVPLLVFVPGTPGKHVVTPRSTIDVAPTILEIFGQPVPNEETDFVRGTSLLRDASGEPALRPILVDMPAGPFNKERRAFYSGTHKLITSQSRPIGLFDLATDPGEKTDLSSDDALKSRMVSEMKAYLATLRPIDAKR